MNRADIVIIFPPISEARFFPYLSLPMLTGYLKEKYLKAGQQDLNIELCHKLFQPSVIQQFLSNCSSTTDIPAQYRTELAKYLIENHSYLYEKVFNKSFDEERDYSAATLFIRRGIELLLEGSALTKERYSLAEIVQDVISLDVPSADIATNTFYYLVKELFQDHIPEVIAISIPYYSQVFPSLLMSKWIKSLSPSTLIVVGGQQMMLRHKDLGNIPHIERLIDAIGTGAGEETLEKLLQFKKGQVPMSEIPNIRWVDEAVKVGENTKQIDITKLPPPSFDNLPVRQYLSKDIQFALVTCVGCYWGRCAFCSYGNRSRFENNYQQKTANQIAEECIHILDRYKTNRINFVDENTNLKLVLKALKILYQRGYKATFSTRNRLEDILLDLDFCRELREYGVVQMSVGYETNSQRLLDLMNKGVNTENYQQIIDNLYEVGIEIRFSVMGGLPTETYEEALESENFLKRNEKKIGIDIVQMLVMEPNTYLSQDPTKYGLNATDVMQLQGNPELSFGMGRMGYSFVYQNGEGYERRIQRLYRLMENVNPYFNDELPKETDDAEIATINGGIRLKEWVKIIEAEIDEGEGTQTLIVDLLFERVFHLPEFIVQKGDTLYSTSNEGKDYIKDMIQLDLAYSV